MPAAALSSPSLYSSTLAVAESALAATSGTPRVAPILAIVALHHEADGWDTRP